MQPPGFLVGHHPQREALRAAFDANARFLKAEIADRRFSAYLSAFRTEDDARASLTAAGVQHIEAEQRARGKRTRG